MDQETNWRWNEFQQVGTDYRDIAEVRAYDARMGEARDVAAENAALLDALALPKDAVVLEIGTGTGAFARAAAARCRRVVALDVSPVMLQYARQRADEEGLDNIDFVEAGFLTYEPGAQRFDAVVTGLALHHLPDLWKAVALERLARWIKPGGRLDLQDVVFDWGGEESDAYFDRLVHRGMPESSRPAFVRHIRQEYSTLGWIMRGLLERAGFEVQKATRERGFLVHYLCSKPVSAGATWSSAWSEEWC